MHTEYLSLKLNTKTTTPALTVFSKNDHRLEVAYNLKFYSLATNLQGSYFLQEIWRILMGIYKFYVG